MSNVVYLRGQPQPLAHFLRIGASGHRRLEELLAAGRLPFTRFVADAGAYARQSELINALRVAGSEIVLDTNVAELSTIGRFHGAAKGAPWADPNGVLTERHFQKTRGGRDVIGQIARFVVGNGITRVMAPTHLLSEAADSWLSTDIASTTALRRALDEAGGKNVAIDYQLMITNATLNDAAQRKAIINSLRETPLDSLWLRVSGFGADATAAGLRKYITASRDFHQLELPVVADSIGGLAGLAALAFGSMGGIAHGVAEKERFDASTWHKPPPPPDPEKKRGGNAHVIMLPGLDRLLKPAQAEALIAASGARRLLSCPDRTCCPHGFEDTIRDPKGHYLRQRAGEYNALSKIPELRRSQHFLDKTLSSADRAARQIAKLRLSDEKLSEALVRNASRIDKMRVVLENLQVTEAIGSRSASFPPAMGIGEAQKGSGK